MPEDTPLSATPCFQQAGRLATNWALIEEIVENCFLILIEADLRKGRFATRNVSYQRQVDGIKLLVAEKLKDQFDKAQFNKVFLKLKDIRIARNNIIHGEWRKIGGTPDNPTIMATEIHPDTLKSISKEYSASEISGWADRANQAEHDLIQFLIKTCGISPLQDTL